ncbi:MAG: universal stress protein [Paludibacter sp.]|nr:universal stress protein [Paludibacter sp.]
MILSVVEDSELAGNLLVSSSKFAAELDKSFGVLLFAKANNLNTDGLIKKPDFVKKADFQLGKLSDYCEENEISFLIIQLSGNKSSEIKKWLKACRELRIPYILFKNSFSVLQLKKIIVPVTFLEEEVEKAQFASAFGRFCRAGVILLQAKDYGSKAANNVARMVGLFKKFDFKYEVRKALKDSFKVDNEAVTLCESEDADLLIVSASREYGLDDIIFGPRELHIVKKSETPVLLVNPRGDLYALCD